jgi:hypothetical protein
VVFVFLILLFIDAIKQIMAAITCRAICFAVRRFTLRIWVHNPDLRQCKSEIAATLKVWGLRAIGPVEKLGDAPKP